MRLITRLMLYATTLILCAHVAGCDSSGTSLFWATDEDGDFHTGDIERAQKEIPFDLVVPHYLPSDIGYPTISGPLKDKSPEDWIDVEINYQQTKPNGFRWLLIEEDNVPMLLPDPTQYSGCVGIEIAGVQVVRCNAIEPVAGVPGWEYHWIQGDISICTSVYGYDSDEAIKIIESMIQ